MDVGVDINISAKNENLHYSEHLILLRKKQLELISRRPARALLTGGSGRKLCLEIGKYFRE